MVMVGFVKRYIAESIEDRLKTYGYVIGQTHQYDMIRKLLSSIDEQSAPLIMGLEDWIIEQYSEIFNATPKGNVKKYLITSADETVVFQVLVDHEKLPFDEIDKELQKEGYQGIKVQQK